jgi:hypothetical protein
VLSILTPALPVDRFASFALFAHATPAAASWGWTFEQAAQVATSIAYALGKPSIVAGSEELDALARWLAFFGTEAWQAESERALRLPYEPAARSSFFSFDDASYGFDDAAWDPSQRVGIVKDLNRWCDVALRDFYTRGERSLTPIGAPSPRSKRGRRRAPPPDLLLSAVRTEYPPNPGGDPAAEAPDAGRAAFEPAVEPEPEPTTAQAAIKAYRAAAEAAGKEPSKRGLKRYLQKHELKFSGKELDEGWEAEGLPRNLGGRGHAG